tara:strand:+ start:622 stop:783 length:162 start_codon:yes stop_codon:yes gene_type:complete
MSLFGYAGTGKTTMIAETIGFLILNKNIKKVCFTASTNKATDVLKSKFGFKFD